MNLEDQVVSLDLAKKLKEIGVKQESLFYWIDNENWSDEDNVIYCPDDEYPRNDFSVSAFTVSELLNMLPIINGSTLELLKAFTLEKGIIYCLRYGDYYVDNSEFCDKNAANVCARMLIYLIENNVYKI